jgi:membrane protein
MRIPGLENMSPVDLGKRALREFISDDMTTYAAALAYASLFALFPFLIFLIAMLSFLQAPGFFDWLLEQGESALPGDAYQRLREVVDQIQNQSQGGLLSFGAVAAVWGASSGVRSLMNAMNVAYDVEETRPMLKRYALSVVYTIGLAILLMVSAALMLFGPQSAEWVANMVGLSSVVVTLWSFLRWPALVLILMLLAAVVYKVMPNVDQPFRLITPGAVLAVVIWVIASLGFSLYVSNFANYSATYGSLGGVIVMLFFFYISAAVLLLGAEINSEVHKVKLGEPEPADDSGN